MKIIHINTIDDEALAPYARLTEAQLLNRLHPEEGAGRHQEAVRSGETHSLREDRPRPVQADHHAAVLQGTILKMTDPKEYY